MLGPGTADGHVVPPAHRALVSRGAAVVLDGGVVAGTWSASRRQIFIDWGADPGRDREAGTDEEMQQISGLPR